MSSCFSNRWIFIEAEYYQIKLSSQALSEQTFNEKSYPGEIFWNDATQYTLVSNDESFVEEVAYMMVTVFRSPVTRM